MDKSKTTYKFLAASFGNPYYSKYYCWHFSLSKKRWQRRVHQIPEKPQSLSKTRVSLRITSVWHASMKSFRMQQNWQFLLLAAISSCLIAHFPKPERHPYLNPFTVSDAFDLSSPWHARQDKSISRYDCGGDPSKSDIVGCAGRRAFNSVHSCNWI